MSIYNWIQKTIFNTYKDWHMKSPLFNRYGFHIDGIGLSLKEIHDGYSMYMEIRPPRAIKGCRSMKVLVGKSDDFVNLYMDINGKTYGIFDLSYDDAEEVMKSFVKHSLLPEESRYVEVSEDESGKIEKAFAELSELLLGNKQHAQQFLKRVAPIDQEAMEDAWIELYEELLRRKRALELSVKLEKTDFVYAIEKLIKNLNLEIEDDLLDEQDFVTDWSRTLNSLWTDYVLTGMDVGSDTYVLLVLSKKDFARAKALARELLHRIALAEEM